MIYVLGWLACSALAFWLFVREWLGEFGEVGLRDVIFFALLSSLGPIGLATAVFAWLTESAPNPTIWKRPKGGQHD